MHALWLFFLHVSGADDTSGTWYGWWSGLGSDLGEFAILTILYRKLNCHVGGCRRIGLHHVVGTGYITCRKHHPTAPKDTITAEHIAREHYFNNRGAYDGAEENTD